jgi:hypothetical protein
LSVDEEIFSSNNKKIGVEELIAQSGSDELFKMSTGQFKMI